MPEIEAYLRDSTFNRGPGGAAKILQIMFSDDLSDITCGSPYDEA